MKRLFPCLCMTLLMASYCYGEDVREIEGLKVFLGDYSEVDASSSEIDTVANFFLEHLMTKGGVDGWIWGISKYKYIEKDFGDLVKLYKFMKFGEDLAKRRLTLFFKSTIDIFMRNDINEVVSKKLLAFMGGEDACLYSGSVNSFTCEAHLPEYLNVDNKDHIYLNPKLLLNKITNLFIDHLGHEFTVYFYEKYLQQSEE
ncbi:hypothetical protein M3P05_12915 [Sansalvadorimonas sp. 2012CJ34-2]|uniref:Uncharacterized protein n=1 Tax=Parendozoicomonas callyspongiae TaxID=2942213 RepID=A0ABT0PHG9_9GAMM|nr:hypothetical protein [Sansalvadorimonas sp. 2012CJ34-2]MCL6270825.1 hypothetical protein [Sansalvadorimonas sp. 2012CJ34-2]